MVQTTHLNPPCQLLFPFNVAQKMPLLSPTLGTRQNCFRKNNWWKSFKLTWKRLGSFLKIDKEIFITLKATRARWEIPKATNCESRADVNGNCWKKNPARRISLHKNKKDIENKFLISMSLCECYFTRSPTPSGKKDVLLACCREEAHNHL